MMFNNLFNSRFFTTTIVAATDDSTLLTIWGLLSAGFVYLLSLVLIRWVLLLKKRNPTSTIAWILIILFLPFVGAVFFLIFGINRVERRHQEREQSRRLFGKKQWELFAQQLISTDQLPGQQQRLMRLIKRVAGTMPTVGNDIELLHDTNRTLGLIEQAIGAAKKTIHLEYYIWQPDKTGSRLRDLLIEKAKQGIEVRFLYDKIGSSHLSRKFIQPMRDAGIQVAAFLPGASFRERWSVNLRSHRKIVIVDGTIGFTGGMNIGDEYLGKNKKFGYWRDTHLKMIGPTVLQLQQVFAEDWFFATTEQLTEQQLFPQAEQIETDNNTASNTPKSVPGKVIAQVVASEPVGNVNELHALMFTAINEAHEQITLATSYFVPPPALVTALESAAYRGVKVRLLLAGRSAYFWTVLAGRSYYDSLLTAGVEIYEYQKGLLHSKTLTIDGQWSLVGTPNFDARSLLLNFEVAVAMYDVGIAIQLEEQFANDLQSSASVSLEDRQNLPGWRVLGELFCRLFAPIL